MTLTCPLGIAKGFQNLIQGSNLVALRGTLTYYKKRERTTQEILKCGSYIVGELKYQIKYKGAISRFKLNI